METAQEGTPCWRTGELLRRQAFILNLEPYSGNPIQSHKNDTMPDCIITDLETLRQPPLPTDSKKNTERRGPLGVGCTKLFANYGYKTDTKNGTKTK